MESSEEQMNQQYFMLFFTINVQRKRWSKPSNDNVRCQFLYEDPDPRGIMNME